MKITSKILGYIFANKNSNGFYESLGSPTFKSYGMKDNQPHCPL